MRRPARCPFPKRARARVEATQNDEARSTAWGPERASRIGCGIRTRGGLTPTSKFQLGALNHSANPRLPHRFRRDRRSIYNPSHRFKWPTNSTH